MSIHGRTDPATSAERCGRHWSPASLPILLALLLVSWTFCLPSSEELKDPGKRGRQALAQAIEAMGGPKYLAVKTEYVKGRDFFFKEGRRSGLVPFQSWTDYQDPVRFRHQIFKGKRQTLTVYNLGLDKAWIQEGFASIEEMARDRLEHFKTSVKQDLHYLLRTRLNEEDLSFFYYGPRNISGSGEIEAVEVIDRTNLSVTIYLNIKTHLPVHIETVSTDQMGFRHELRTEFFNWHEKEGVLTPLSFHSFENGEKSRETFFVEITYNNQLPPEYFLEPQLTPDQAKKAAKKKKKKKRQGKN